MGVGASMSPELEAWKDKPSARFNNVIGLAGHSQFLYPLPSSAANLATFEDRDHCIKMFLDDEAR